jgi:hypothetical protein
MTLEFSGQIFEKSHINFMKIPPVGAELFLADEQTDMKLTVVFRNFANAPKTNG